MQLPLLTVPALIADPRRCSHDAIVGWSTREGPVYACERHRWAMTPVGRFNGFALLRAGTARCEWRAEA